MRIRPAALCSRTGFPPPRIQPSVYDVKDFFFCQKDKIVKKLLHFSLRCAIIINVDGKPFPI
jgi:hypothetical protein